jgi:signal transduction histidine kinase
MAQPHRTSPEMRLGARALAGLYAAGATLSLLTVVLPHSGRANEAGLLAIVVVAYAVAFILFRWAASLPGWGLPLTLALGSTLITGVAYFSAETPSPLIFFYLWVFLFSSYFFERRLAAAQIAYVGLVYGALLIARPPAGGIATWWLVALGTLLVAAILVRVMRERADELIASLSRTATERRRAQEELKIHRDHLEDLIEVRTAALSVANKELEAFSYSVSHDLRAPLRSMDGFSQALLDDYESKLDAEGTDYLHRIRAASQRMAQLIDDMLRLSKLARSEMHRGSVDVTALARATAEGLHETDPTRAVTFRIADGISANGDEVLLRAVVENLLGNAWKFTSHHQEATIELGTTQEDGELVYFVRDDGAGFDMEHAGQLFGAFQRLHSRDDFEGTGIGLATVQRIIHRHGGRIWGEAELEQGAIFSFTLPHGKKASALD